MEKLLNQAEIDDLLKNLQIQKSQPSIVEITQRDIDRISDIALRAERQIQFNYVNEIFVKPLEKILLFYSRQKGNTPKIYNLGDLSIMNKISRLREELLALGFTGEQLSDFVPKKEEEVSLIISALKQGYKYERMYNNELRLLDVKAFLESKKNSDQEVAIEELSSKRM